MKSIKKTLPVLLVMLPLLMANSPSPYPYPLEYEDFSNTSIQLVDSDEEKNKYIYETTITNDGDGYISLGYVNLYENRKHVTSSFAGYEFYLAPSKSAVVSFIASRKIDAIERLNIGCSGYLDEQIDKTATYSNPSAFKEEDSDSIKHKYVMDVELDYDKGYTYSILINYTYDGTQYVTREVYEDSKENSVYFQNAEEIDVTKIALESIVFVQGRPKGDYSYPYVFLYLGLAVIGSIVGTGIFIALIAFAIVGIISVVRSSRKKKTDSK